MLLDLVKNYEVVQYKYLDNENQLKKCRLEKCRCRAKGAIKSVS